MLLNVDVNVDGKLCACECQILEIGFSVEFINYKQLKMNV